MADTLSHTDAMNRCRVRYGRRLATLVWVNRNRTRAKVQLDDGSFLRVPLDSLRRS